MGGREATLQLNLQSEPEVLGLWKSIGVFLTPSSHFSVVGEMSRKTKSYGGLNNSL